MLIRTLYDIPTNDQKISYAWPIGKSLNNLRMCPLIAIPVNPEFGGELECRIRDEIEYCRSIDGDSTQCPPTLFKIVTLNNKNELLFSGIKYITPQSDLGYMLINEANSSNVHAELGLTKIKPNSYSSNEVRIESNHQNYPSYNPVEKVNNYLLQDPYTNLRTIEKSDINYTNNYQKNQTIHSPEYIEVKQELNLYHSNCNEEKERIIKRSSNNRPISRKAFNNLSTFRDKELILEKNCTNYHNEEKQYLNDLTMGIRNNSQSQISDNNTEQDNKAINGLTDKNKFIDDQLNNSEIKSRRNSEKNSGRNLGNDSRRNSTKNSRKNSGLYHDSILKDSNGFIMEKNSKPKMNKYISNNNCIEIPILNVRSVNVSDNNIELEKEIIDRSLIENFDNQTNTTHEIKNIQIKRNTSTKERICGNNNQLLKDPNKNMDSRKIETNPINRERFYEKENNNSRKKYLSSRYSNRTTNSNRNVKSKYPYNENNSRRYKICRESRNNSRKIKQNRYKDKSITPPVTRNPRYISKEIKHDPNIIKDNKKVSSIKYQRLKKEDLNYSAENLSKINMKVPNDRSSYQNSDQNHSLNKVANLHKYQAPNSNIHLNQCKHVNDYQNRDIYKDDRYIIEDIELQKIRYQNSNQTSQISRHTELKREQTNQSVIYKDKIIYNSDINRPKHERYRDDEYFKQERLNKDNMNTLSHSRGPIKNHENVLLQNNIDPISHDDRISNDIRLEYIKKKYNTSITQEDVEYESNRNHDSKMKRKKELNPPNTQHKVYYSDVSPVRFFSSGQYQKDFNPSLRDSSLQEIFDYENEFNRALFSTQDDSPYRNQRNITENHKYSKPKEYSNWESAYYSSIPEAMNTCNSKSRKNSKTRKINKPYIHMRSVTEQYEPASRVEKHKKEISNSDKRNHIYNDSGSHPRLERKKGFNAHELKTSGKNKIPENKPVKVSANRKMLPGALKKCLGSLNDKPFYDHIMRTINTGQFRKIQSFLILFKNSYGRQDVRGLFYYSPKDKKFLKVPLDYKQYLKNIWCPNELKECMIESAFRYDSGKHQFVTVLSSDSVPMEFFGDVGPLLSSRADGVSLRQEYMPKQRAYVDSESVSEDEEDS